MIRNVTGRYVTNPVAGEIVRAFVPKDLPPVPQLALAGSRQRLLERAIHAVGKLDSVSTLLPDPYLFLYAYVRREAVLSSQIEGTQSSISDLLLFELEEVPGVPMDDAVEVSNYVSALNHGIKRMDQGFPLCNRLLREMHVRLMAGARGSDKQPGEFRRSQNWIGGTRPGNARFVPPPPNEVEACMAALERFLHDEDDEIPLLIKAALAHVQFETIHPFLDGNGRLGRLLIIMMLHSGELLSQPLLYLSLYFKQHRSEYYDLLDRIRAKGDWEKWIDFFLEGVEQTALGAVATARRLMSLFDADVLRIQAIGRGSAKALVVYETLRKRPMITLRELCNTAGMTFPTASKALQHLVAIGIVRELTGRRRNRIFIYLAYINILHEYGEPLHK